MQAEEELISLLETIERRRKFHKIDYYEPYEFQKAFHAAKGYKTDVAASQRALMCANQIGKTTCGAMEVAYHATGLYPDWWEGFRFDKAVRILCGSNTNEQTRDNLQGELCGDPADDNMLGTGAIPRDLLGERIRKPGVPNAFDSIAVTHVSGDTSRVMFRAYEQGAKKHMGSRINFGWMDEEPPQDIFSQYLRGTFATGGKLIITFTPEEGVTDVVHQFMTDLKMGQSLTTATWDDAPHMTKERRDEFLAQIPAHEREMRTRGLPKMGSGLVFPVPDEEIIVDPFQLPDHWPRLIGMDFGWEHPTAAIWQAWDRDSDTVYVYHDYRQSKAVIPISASAIKNGSDPWIPVAWPHDGMKKDPQSGRPMADLYRREGLNMLVKPFSNPPAPGMKDGSGGQGVEVGIMAMLTAMEEGRYRVFSSCRDWFEEKGTYHRKDGQLVKLRDDIMSASRYAYQSRRYSATRPSQKRAATNRVGMRTW
jgi:phage terminase large subunit-like protein